ncbi:clusterin-associated protein 1-like isoform X2 [Brevipalpus obovatus]|uniref:clusterin-associated protein 1-like isoform X2 n=1 Tax=Brevipalpus obovatus TaxID=246614 RepID=UPI003D9F119D
MIIFYFIPVGNFHRLDPSSDIPSHIDTEQDRVIFVKTCVQLINTKAFIDLDAKNIYSSDSTTITELLRIASLLYQATKINDHPAEEISEDDYSLISEQLISKSNELKRARQLASKITQRGVLLSDLLDKDVELTAKRNQILNNQTEITAIEKALQDEIKSLEKEIQSLNFKIENVASDEANIDVKIEKKQQELERYQKRLQALKAVRPAYMDEYEKLEDEITLLYEKYVSKYRNMMYLDFRLEGYEKAEMDRMQARKEQVRKMIEAMKEEEALRAEDGSETDLDPGILLGLEEEEDDDDYGYGGDVQSRQNANEMTGLQNTPTGMDGIISRSLVNPALTTTGRETRTGTGKVRVFGDLLAGEREDSLNSDLSLDADDQSELDSEDERELMNLNHHSKDINARHTKDSDDNDF